MTLEIYLPSYQGKKWPVLKGMHLFSPLEDVGYCKCPYPCAMKKSPDDETQQGAMMVERIFVLSNKVPGQPCYDSCYSPTNENLAVRSTDFLAMHPNIPYSYETYIKHFSVWYPLPTATVPTYSEWNGSIYSIKIFWISAPI